MFLCNTVCMKITIHVKPQSKKSVVVLVEPSTLFTTDRSSEYAYKVYVKEPAQEGKANSAVIRLLSEYFNVPQSCIRITHGQTTPQKVVEVDV